MERYRPGFIVLPSSFPRMASTSQRLTCLTRPGRRTQFAKFTWRATASDDPSEGEVPASPTPPTSVKAEPDAELDAEFESELEMPAPLSDEATDSSDEEGELFESLVPGKMQLSESELAAQKKALEKYAAELRDDRLRTEREAARLFGWVPYAELMNGRFAMFFFVTGLCTEYWTGDTIPEQVELLLRTLGVF